MTPFEIPLIPSAQTFTVTLGSKDYRFTLTWNRFSESWTVNIADVENRPLAYGLALVTGADLLEQLAYLLIGGGLEAQTDNDTDAVPTFANLGSTGHLFFLSP